jgi:hypothetical protein
VVSEGVEGLLCETVATADGELGGLEMRQRVVNLRRWPKDTE